MLSTSFYVANRDDGPTLLVTDGATTSWITALTQAFQDAAIQGVTICIEAGQSQAQAAAT